MRAAYTKDLTLLKTVLLILALALVTVVLEAPPNRADAQEAVTPQPGNNCAAGEKIEVTDPKMVAFSDPGHGAAQRVGASPDEIGATNIKAGATIKKRDATEQSGQ